MGHVLKDATILFGSVEIASQVSSLDLGAQADTAESTNFGSAGWREHLSSLRMASWTLEMFREEQSPDEEAWDFGSGQPVTASLDRPVAEDDEAYAMRCVRTQYAINETLGDVARETLAMQGETPMVKGVLLGVEDAANASGEGTALEKGAITASQVGYAGLHVLSASGGGTLDVTVESDDAQGFASAATRITFTQETDATAGYQWVTVAGAVTDTWWRVAWTVSGTFTFRVFFGIQ